jgi:hypothetical protein
MQRLVATAAALVCSLVAASPAAAIGIAWPNGNPAADPYFGVVTNAGIYYIARQCYNERPDGARRDVDMGYFGNQIGPGYIFATASVDRDGAWRTKTRDYLDVASSDSRSGGWARFSIQITRQGGYPGQGQVYKDLQVGVCRPGASGPSDPGEPGPPFYGSGVSRVGGVVGPYISGGEAVFAIDVYLHDGVTEVLKVTYNYRISETAVRLWTGVQQLCGGGFCPAGGGRVFVKEPEFSVSDYAYSTNDGTDTPYNWLLGVAPFPWGSWNFACWNNALSNYRINAPYAVRGNTLHCADYRSELLNEWRYRQQMWFKYADSGQGVGTDCNPRKCTWVVARGATGPGPGAGVNYWTDTGLGLDQWAKDVAGQPPFAGGSGYCLSNYPSDLRDQRRWEIGGWGPYAPSGSPPPEGVSSVQAGFIGWNGGTGPSDCLNLFRPMTSTAAVYSNYFEISFQ